MNIPLTIIICFLAGAGAGLGTGFAGMSAAAVIGPVLTAFLGIPAYDAVGIGLASDVLASAASAVTYKKSNNLDIKNSFTLMMSVLCMTVVGSLVASLLPDTAMGNTTLIAMMIIGIRFLLKPITTTKAQMLNISQRRRIIQSIVGGALIGFICGFVGAGGGMMMLFVLTTFLGYELHMAVGTSVFIMAFTALTGSVSHFAVGGAPNLLALGVCVASTLLWALIASRIANNAKTSTLNRIVGAVLILTGIAVLIFKFFEN